MKRRIRASSVLCSLVGAVVLLDGVAPAAERASPADVAKEILANSGVRGGLVVQLGCGDGTLTAALRADGGFLVHGLEADAAKVEQARKHIQSLGLYGPVSVERFDGKHLPYADNLVNLVIAEDLGGVSREELLRVICPGGVVCVKRQGQRTKTVNA